METGQVHTEAEQAWQSERDRIAAEVDANKETALRLAKDNAELREEIARVTENTQSRHEQTARDGDRLVATIEAGLGASGNGDGNNKSDDPDRTTLKVGPDASRHLSNDVSSASYSRRQLQVLSVLREGGQMNAEQLFSRLRGDKFQVQRAIDRLLELRLLTTSLPSRALLVTAMGRAVLGAFVDDGQWNFATEGF